MWCSLSVQGAGVQIQALRFALLIVLTVALASVAFRIDSHSSSSPSSQPRTHVPAMATPGNPQTSAPSKPSPTPTHHSHPATSGGSNGGSNGGINGGSSGGGAAAGAPEQLPVTGWDSAMKLGGLAFALIGGGWLTIRGAGPSSARRQRASVHD